VVVVTVHLLEAGVIQPRRATLEVIRRIFEAAGVEFIDEKWRRPRSAIAKEATKKGVECGEFNITKKQVYEAYKAVKSNARAVSSSLSECLPRIGSFAGPGVRDETMRSNGQEIEDGELQVVETTSAEGKDAA
jgi:hypothetical protein